MSGQQGHRDYDDGRNGPDGYGRQGGQQGGDSYYQDDQQQYYNQNGYEAAQGGQQGAQQGADGYYDES